MMMKDEKRGGTGIYTPREVMLLPDDDENIIRRKTMRAN